MKLSLLIPPIFLSLLACKYEMNNQVLATGYFSMDSLVDQQINRLTILNPELEKEAVLDDQSVSVKIHLDSLGWENELKVFRDANIDKPAFYGVYSLVSAVQDSFSNLLYNEYSISSDSEDLPVKNLRIYYLDGMHAIKKIEILIKDKNELFESERHLLLNFENREGIPLLSSYHVQGSQKLQLNDSVKYEMNSILIF